MSGIQLLDPPSLAGLNAEQRQAVTAVGHVQVMAGPGTGKTEVIARRYVWLWQQLQAEHPDKDAAWLENQLLVVTFTNKSAQEMKHRIQQRLAACLDNPVELEGRWIGTFHAICQQWLRQWGLLPTLLTDLEQFQQDRQLISQLAETGVDTIQDALTAYQLNVPVDCLSLSALAALPLPEVMPFLQDLPRLVQAIQAAGLSPSAFYQNAMAQTQTYTQRLLSLPAAEPVTGQPFASAADAMEAWRRHLQPLASPLWRCPSFADEATPAEVFKPLKVLKTWLLGKADRKTKAYPPQDLTPLHQMLTEQALVEQALIPVIAAFYAWRLYLLRMAGQSDYDGLIQAVLDAWNRYNPQFAGVIVDECQDINPAQCALLSGLHPRLGLMAVGDPKQSIYSFRFAEPENMRHIFANKPAVSTVNLVRNYRSTAGILAVANQFALQQHLDEMPPLVPHRAEAERDAFQQVNGEAGKLADQREDELAHLTDILRQYNQHFAWADMAVLCQKNHRAMAIFTQLTQVGIPARLQKVSGLMQQPAVMDAMAITQILMDWAGTPTEPSLALAWVRLLQHYLNDAELYALSQAVYPFSWPTGIKSLYQTGRLPNAVQTIVTALLAASEEPMEPPQVVQRVEQVMTQTAWMEAYAPHRLQLEAFAHWQFLAEQTGKTAESLSALWAAFDHYTQYPHLLPDMPESGENAVHILTGHSAKGLEFPVVCLAWTDRPTRWKPATHTVLFEPQHAGMPGMGLMLRQWHGEKTLKSELAESLWHKPRLDAEQQRLFYVALTRAKDRLILYRSDQSPAWTDLWIG